MFTENQVRQFYVIPTGSADTTNVKQPTKVVPGTSGTYPADLKALANGACQFVVTPSGEEAYMLYKGPFVDGLQRSDFIKKCNVMDVRVTDAADLVHKNKKAIVTIDPSLVDSSNLTVTGDYVLNISINNYLAAGYDSTKIKFGAARGVAGTSASNLYKKLALNLAKNFSREPAPFVDIYLCKTDLTSATSTAAKFIKVTGSTSASSLTDTYLGICIEEVAQPWRLGAAKAEFVDFSVEPATVYANGADVIWGKVQFYGSAKYTDGTTSSITIGAPYTQVNSKQVADMEYFFHKERGDRYGLAGFPYNIDTVYQVNPNLADGYSFLDIHFYFEGNSHNVGKSEKTLTVVGSKANIKRFIGNPYTPAQGSSAAVDATGLYAFLEGTGVEVKASASW